MDRHHFIREKKFEERVVQIDRVSRTVKGGRRISFRALIVVGDGRGKIGYGTGKGKEVALAIDKAKKKAIKRMKKISIINDTISRPIQVKFSSAHLMLKPAPAGTSIIAGGPIRAVLEVAGIKNIVAKSLGSANKANNVKACILALEELSKNETPSTSPSKKS